MASIIQFLMNPRDEPFFLLLTRRAHKGRDALPIIGTQIDPTRPSQSRLSSRAVPVALDQEHVEFSCLIMFDMKVENRASRL